MRWVVELPADNGGSAPTVTVDGESWKAALGAARGGKSLPKYRCDFDEDGTVKVHDYATNERFALRPLKSVVASDAAARPSNRPMVPTDGSSRTSPAIAPAYRATPEPARAEVVAPTERRDSAPAPALALTDSVPPPRPSLAEEVLVIPPPASLVFQRGRDPVGGAGLTYRERVLAVPRGTSVVEAERIAREVWIGLRAQLERFDAGKFVTVAVFDHAFSSMPERPPLVVLTWKDWRGGTPDVTFSAFPVIAAAPVVVAPPAAPAAPVVAPAPAAAAAPVVAAPITEPVVAPAAAAAPVARQSMPSIIVADDAFTASPAAAPSAPVIAPAPTRSEPAVASPARVASTTAPRPRRASRPDLATAPRGPAATRRGDELLGDAFEATHDLAFLHEPDEACALIAALARDLLDSAFVAVSIYDIDRDEFVLQSVEGGTLDRGRRAPLAFGPRGESAIQSRVIVTDQPPSDDPLLVTPPAGPAMYASAQFNHRLFGVIEVRRAGKGGAYGSDEQHAVAFMAEQLGKFLAEHSRRIGFRDDAR